MAEKISGIYKITNTITKDFYIGSSKNIKSRWSQHKCPSRWKRCSNNPMYHDMQKYGVDKFIFEILAEVDIESLKEKEQQLIEKLKPTYNDRNANGWNTKRYKEYKKEYNKEYNQHNHETIKKYNSQPCCYKGRTLTLNALSQRFRRAGIENPKKEAKKYLINNCKVKYTKGE